MQQNIRLMATYPIWYYKARNRHGIHSPFLYQFLDTCLYADKQDSTFDFIEQHRKQLKKDKTLLQYPDPGAGSRLQIPATGKTQRQVRVCTLARTSLQRASFCRLLYRMAIQRECSNILELGTSLGIATAYLSVARPNGFIDTIEGASPVAQLASAFFRKHHLNNINLQQGLFEDMLSEIPPDRKYDLIYLDGDHHGEKVIAYFHKLIKHIHKDSVLVIDDIRWSDSMYEAWKSLCSAKGVSVSVDMFFSGLLFFDPRLSKEHFKIRFP